MDAYFCDQHKNSAITCQIFVCLSCKRCCEDYVKEETGKVVTNDKLTY
jgi:hypothetical protein